MNAEQLGNKWDVSITRIEAIVEALKYPEPSSLDDHQQKEIQEILALMNDKDIVDVEEAVAQHQKNNSQLTAADSNGKNGKVTNDTNGKHRDSASASEGNDSSAGRDDRLDQIIERAVEIGEAFAAAEVIASQEVYEQCLNSGNFSDPEKQSAVDSAVKKSADKSKLYLDGLTDRVKQKVLQRTAGK